MADHVCPWWCAYLFDHPGRRLFQKPERILSPFVREGMTVLDLGCGMGFYSIAMARLVGPTGRVISVDLQQRMLDVLLRRARKKGVAARITPFRCTGDDIGTHGPADFALAFWMIHETPDQERFARQVARSLKPGARFLLVEPRGHVKEVDFAVSRRAALAAGFVSEGPIPIRLSVAEAFRLERPAG